MKIPVRQSSAGIALVIVMISILVLSTMAAIFAASMKVESHLAQKANSDPGLLWLGRSGVEFARWAVAQEAAIPGQPGIALNQHWAGGSGSPSETNSVLAGIPWDHYDIGDGWVSVTIIDLDRYANINTADSTELKKALDAMGVQDPTLISAVSDSIQDWVNPGDLPRMAGAKSDFYQGLNPPYNCKDAPIDDMTELLLIRGIMDHPEIYYGGRDPNQSGPVFQHKLGFGNAPGEPEDLQFGLKDVFTPFNPGLININTADDRVLQCIPGVDATIAESIRQFRAGPDGAEGTADDIFIQNLSQLATAGVSPQAIAQMGGYCTTRNPVATFKVTITAHLGNISRDYYAILFLNGRNVQTVSFYWDQ